MKIVKCVRDFIPNVTSNGSKKIIKDISYILMGQ